MSDDTASLFDKDHPTCVCMSCLRDDFGPEDRVAASLGSMSFHAGPGPRQLFRTQGRATIVICLDCAVDTKFGGYDPITQLKEYEQSMRAHMAELGGAFVEAYLQATGEKAQGIWDVMEEARNATEDCGEWLHSVAYG